MKKTGIWLYRAIPLVFFFGGASILATFGAGYTLGWIHIVFSMVIVYPIIKLESKLFPENR